MRATTAIPPTNHAHSAARTPDPRLVRTSSASPVSARPGFRAGTRTAQALLRSGGTQNEVTDMPHLPPHLSHYAAVSAPSRPLHAHRPEPVEPPTAPPIAPPDPAEPDTIPGPTPDPIEPVEPVTLPIGDPPPQPTQTPQAADRPSRPAAMLIRPSIVGALSRTRWNHIPHCKASCLGSVQSIAVLVTKPAHVLPAIYGFAP
ncbi:hypothetical protein OKW39_001461 [Paraburkholderia sp. MM6662-R1]